MRQKRILILALAMSASLLFARYSSAQEMDYTDDELSGDQVSAIDVVQESELSVVSNLSQKELLDLKQTEPLRFNHMIKQRLNYLQELRKNLPEKYESIMDRVRRRKQARLERLKKEDPERYNRIMEKRKALPERKKDTRPGGGLMIN
ncbi:MAG: hypothetical protein FJZ10_05800 [Candidatus Omnitrophica bacterium]|nr:hypothetical protein [Candidatus Omnitrophota bacterium]